MSRGLGEKASWYWTGYDDGLPFTNSVSSLTLTVSPSRATTRLMKSFRMSAGHLKTRMSPSSIEPRAGMRRPFPEPRKACRGGSTLSVQGIL